MEAALIRETGRHISFPVETAVLDYPSLITTPGGASRATVVGSRSEVLDRYQTTFKRAGLQVELLDVSTTSLIRLHRKVRGLGPQAALLCHIDRSHSHLAAVTAEEILGHRFLDWGYRKMVDKLLANLDEHQDTASTEFLLRRYGLAPEECKPVETTGEIADPQGLSSQPAQTVCQIITPLVEELLHEFRKLISYIRSEMSEAVFEGVYFYGLAEAIKGLAHYIGDRLNLPANTVDPFADDGLDPAGKIPDAHTAGLLIPALGLAMRRVSWL